MGLDSKDEVGMIHHPGSFLGRSVSWVMGMGMLVATLFALLVRGSVFFCHTWAFGASISLVCAVVMTVPLLLLGARVIIRWERNRPKGPAYAYPGHAHDRVYLYGLRPLVCCEYKCSPG